MEFDYTKTTNKNFYNAVLAVQKEIENAGMRVLYTHDTQKTLKEKGINREPFKIIEFCNAKYANDFLNQDIKIGLCMPCKINVYVLNEEVYISGMRPIVLPMFFPKANLGKMPQEIDKIIQNIINNSV